LRVGRTRLCAFGSILLLARGLARLLVWNAPLQTGLVLVPDEVEMAQQSQVTSNFRVRRSFGKIKKIIDIPNLIEIQKRSYEEFLQADVAVEQ